MISRFESKSSKSLKVRVPVVLDGIVCTAGEQLGDFGPLVPHQRVLNQNQAVLRLGPRRLANVGVEVVVPSLPALLPDPAGQMARNLAPLLGTQPSNQLHDELVLLLRPGTLRGRWAQGAVASCALSRGALQREDSFEVGRDARPVRGTFRREAGHGLEQLGGAGTRRRRKKRRRRRSVLENWRCQVLRFRLLCLDWRRLTGQCSMISKISKVGK